MGQWYWCIRFYLSNLIFGNFHFLVYLLNPGFWLAEKNQLFDWFAGWSSSGYAYTIGTLRGSALVIGFDCGALFIWVPSWFTSWSFFWPTSLTGTLGGTAGGVAFLNISAGVYNSSLCPCPNYTKGMQVMDSVVYILDLVWHDKLHPWKTYVAY